MILITTPQVTGEPGELQLGSDWFDRLSPDQHARRLARQIEALGFTVTIEHAA